MTNSTPVRVLETKETSAYEVKIFIAGPISVAEQIIRDQCFHVGMCVTVTPTKYIYTMGEEVGYIVGFINYARFPSDEKAIDEQAIELAKRLLYETHQGSVTVQTPTRSFFFSLRGEIQNAK